MEFALIRDFCCIIIKGNLIRTTIHDFVVNMEMHICQILLNFLNFHMRLQLRVNKKAFDLLWANNILNKSQINCSHVNNNF